MFIRDLPSGDFYINPYLRHGDCNDCGDTHPVPITFMVVLDERPI